MARKKIIYTKLYPYHITGRTNNKENFILEQEIVWEVFISKLDDLKNIYNFDIKAFVLMSNHYHLLVSTPDENISAGMAYFHSQVAKEINLQSGRINHLFGDRYKWSIIANEKYYWNVVKYIYRNPIKAGICKKVEDYQFSSLSSNKSLFKMTDYFFDNSKPINLELEWLNHAFSREEDQAITKGLKKKEFKIARNQSGFAVNVAPLRKK